MAITFYDISAATYLQTLGAVSGFLAKGRAHCEKKGIDLDAVVETRLWPDMLPFRFQVVSVAHHSLGALEGIEAGVFKPPAPAPDRNYGELEQLVSETRAAIEGYSRAAVEALRDNDIQFKIGDMALPFTAASFVLSFSHPNLFFHAATAYDILRTKGVPLGKRDFMGGMRFKT